MEQITSMSQAVLETVKSISDSLNSVLTMTQTGVILKIILLVLLIGLGIYKAVNNKKTAIDDARKEEGHDDNVNHNTAVNQNTTDNQQVEVDSKRVDDLLKGASNEQNGSSKSST